MDGPLFIMHRNKYTDVPKKGSRGICFGASPFILPTFILKTWGLMRARVLRTTIRACVKYMRDGGALIPPPPFRSPTVKLGRPKDL